MSRSKVLLIVFCKEDVTKVLKGQEYTDAREMANDVNGDLRKLFGLKGTPYDIHELQPIKFGGSPIDPTNKLLIPRTFHQQFVTPWWNALERQIGPFTL